jgi:hypothetical protein
MVPVGVACSLNQELMKGHEMAVSHEEASAFNAKLELCNIREWLGRLRGKVDVEIERLNVVLNNLKSSGSGQGTSNLKSFGLICY